MTKRELIELLAEKLSDREILKRDIEVVVDTIFNSMTEALVHDQRVEIRDFGSFSIKIRNAKEARNPKTGERVLVDKKRVPFWRTGKELKERVFSAYAKQLEQQQEPEIPFSVGD